MLKFKNKFICFYAVLSVFFGNIIEIYSQGLPKITPPSPTAYELGKYGDIPIGLFTGSPNVSIPLLEYKIKDLTIPITLGYSSNGIKVDQLETKVGLGWVINTGGIITRTIRQGPDELRGVKQPVVINENYKSQEFIDYYNTIINGTKLDNSGSLIYDSEPDIFNFNFLGRSGRFTTNNDGEIVLLSDFSLKVTYIPGGFLIIDELGIKYYFNTSESSRLDSTGDNGTSNMGNYSTTSWSISKIIMPNNEVVNFNYADEVYNYVTTQDQSLSMYENYPISDVSSDNCRMKANPPREGPLMSYNLSIHGKSIIGISCTNAMYGTINFEYNTVHPQVANYGMLSSVNIKNNVNGIVEKVALEYITAKQRMFLNKVTFLDPDKKYNFEYGNLYDLPNRLSFAKDRWGYYNGKSNGKLYPNLSGPNNITENFFNEIFPQGANRDLDETKAKIGLLQKIIYPTRAYSEFEYESNDYPTSENVSTIGNKKLEVSTTLQDPLYAEKADTFTFTYLGESKLVPLNISFSLNYQSPCAYNPTTAKTDRKLFVEITNLTNPLHDTGIVSLQGAPYAELGNRIIITESDVYMNKYSISLTKDNSYKIKISVFYQCLTGQVNFDYATSPAKLVFFNKKTGGLRVSKVTNKESSGTYLSSKKYFYAQKEHLDTSSGTYSRPPNYISKSYDGGVCFWFNNHFDRWTLTYNNLNSNDLAYKYLPEFQYSRYEYVTVSDDNDQFQNGGMEYHYRVVQLQQMSPNAMVFGTFQEAFPENENSWGDGLNLEKTTFKKVGGVFKSINKEIYDYRRDSRINEIIHGFKLLRKWPNSILINNTPLADAEDALLVTKYDITTNWNYLSYKATQVFDSNGQNPIGTVTNYFYDNPLHCQLTRTITNSSNGKPIITKTYYPDDAVTTNSLGLESLSVDAFNSINKLKTPTWHQTGTPIQTETYSDDNNDGTAISSELLNTKRTNYKDWGNNNILPEKIQILKGEYNSGINALETRITYNKYDDKGNPLELQLTNDKTIVYIWGYNKTLPVAKIENATYAQVETLMGGAGFVLTDGLSATQETALRTGLPNAMVTTYTHKPLIGVSTITDAKGDKVTYEYDGFNRLKWILDKNGNKLSENEYHYKNP
jgi:hypothetical protein